jgi:hypothetical protein
VKKYLLIFSFTLLVLFAPRPALAQQGPVNDLTPDITPLSNKDILVMVEKRVSEGEIVVAIISSPCVFDTFPPVLEDLKRRGVTEPALKAMLTAPYGPSAKMLHEELDEQAIYHYADQLRQRNMLNSSPGRRGSENARRAAGTRPPRTAARRRA